ncbi:MAG: hypothetical protein HC880_01485 [Bacteroidia bacterium]|nr:hypothetical protein [Bacteroidia bacterium]
MADSQHILKAMMDTQSKSVENLMDASKKMQESVGKSNSMETMAQIYKEWYTKQEEITNEMNNAIKDQMITDKTPTFVKDWIDAQEKFSTQWSDAFKNMASIYPGNQMLDTYQDNVDKFFSVWKKSYDQFAGMFTTTYGVQNYDLTAQAKEMHDRFVENARKYLHMLEGQQATQAPKKK